MRILGLSFSDHEASVAMVVDGALTTAVARERLSRLKRDGKMWGGKRIDLTAAIEYCLEDEGVAISDIDLLCWNHIDHMSVTSVLEALAREGGADLAQIPLIVLPHHFAHACYAYYTSPFESAAVLVADGSGGPLAGLTKHCAGPEPGSIKAGRTIVQNLRDDCSDEAREHESFYWVGAGEWHCLRKIVGDYGGIGAEYGAASELLFGDCLDAGKTMGLAPYASPDASFSFLRRTGPESMPAFRSHHPVARDQVEDQIRKMCPKSAGFDYTHPLTAAYAATIQREAEEALLQHARWLRERSQSSNLCLSGGVALNCVANARLAREAGYAAIFVPPAPGDDGISIGCALYASAMHGELKRDTCQRPPFLARSYVAPHVGISIASLPPKLRVENLNVAVAQRIAQGQVVAWFQDGAEVGPRALGHRSFLADPRAPWMRDHLNHRVKRREAFRPFAPVVLDEAVLEYFEARFPSYYMSFVANIRPDKRAQLPAVCHVDGTARYQVLRQSDNPQLYDLIKRFADLTGVQMLLNTSFNRAGEPLVETPEDAVRCFLASGADCLILDGDLYPVAQ